MRKRKARFAAAFSAILMASVLVSVDRKEALAFDGMRAKNSAVQMLAAGSMGTENPVDDMAEIYEGTCGTDLTWKLSGGVLTISGTGAMTNWSSGSGVPWYSDRSSVTTVVIETGVTSIGNNAFYGCSSLTSAEIPEGVVSIGNSVFQNCSSLTAVEIPEGTADIGSSAFQNCSSLVTVKLPESLATLSNYAFRGCTSLEEVRIPSGLTNVSGSSVFRDCTSLTKVVMGSGMSVVPANICRDMTALTTVEYEEGVNITRIGDYAFYNCTSLAGMNIPGTAEQIGNYAFYGCSSLTSAEIPEGVVSIGSSAFQNCSSLVTVKLPESLATLSNYAFRGCTSLEEVRIPSGLTNVSGSSVFRDCTSLTKVVMGSGMSVVPANICRDMTALTTVEYEEGVNITRIGDYAFYNCTSLAELNIPGTAEQIGNYAFYGCSSLTAANIPEGIVSIGNSVFQNCTSLADVKLPESLTTIGSYAFGYCSRITSVSFPEKLNSIGSYAFRNCSGLTEITFPDGLAQIGSYAFQNCTGLTVLQIPGGLSSLGNNMFSGCTNLTKIVFLYGLTGVPSYMCSGMSSLTEVVFEEGPQGEASTMQSIGANAFYNCTGLEHISLPEGITSIGNSAFYGCTSLETAELPYELTDIGNSVFYNCTAIKDINIPSKVTRLGDYIFYNCTSLEKVRMAGEITRIGASAFYGCSVLKSIELPPSVTAIGSSAFYNCSLLEEADLPSGLSSLGDHAFANCTNLLAVNLEDTALTAIGSRCFMNCTSLKRIYIPGNIKTINNEAFSGCSAVNALTLSEGVKTLGGACFADCVSLSDVTIPRSVSSAGISSSKGPFTGCANLTNVTFAEKTRLVPQYLFYGCGQLTEITLPDTVSEIGAYAFYNCTNLESVNVPSALYSIGNYAFYGCSGITSMDLSGSVTDIGTYAFSNCSSLREVLFSEFLTAISDYCFEGTSLTNVSLPYRVASIGNGAFRDVATLREIVIPAATASIRSSAFDQDTLTIRGTEGSAARTYAEEKGYDFAAGESFTKAKLSTESLFLPTGNTACLVLDVEPYNASDAIAWNSGNEEIATVTADAGNPAEAVVRGIAPGETTVTVTAGNITNTCHVTVGNYVTAISLSQQFIYMDSLEDSAVLRASVTPSDAENGTLVWSSSNEKVAVVKKEENSEENEVSVIPIGNGTARIMAETDKGLKAYCFVTVDMEIPATDVTISEKNLYMTGGTRKLDAVVTPEGATNGTLIWSSSDTGVVKVDENGLVTAVADGEAEIEVRTADAAFSDVCRVTVKLAEVPVSGITLDREEVELTAVDTVCQLAAAIVPENADDQKIYWSSSDTSVASVSEDGVVTAVGAGVTEITAETRDGGYTLSCRITVIRLIDVLTLDHGTLNLKTGETQRLTVTIAPDKVSSNEVKWTSSNTNIAAVDSDGVVTAAAPGTAYIRCRAQDGSMATASCKVIVYDDSVPLPDDKPDNTETEPGETNTGGTVAPGEQPDEGRNDPVTNIKKPKKAKISRLTAGNKKMKVTWKKLFAVTGYEIQYSLNKKFKKPVTVKVKNPKAVQKTLKKLKGKKKYYFRVRGYAAGTVNGEPAILYGSWSAVKSKKTK